MQAIVDLLPSLIFGCVFSFLLYILVRNMLDITWCEPKSSRLVINSNGFENVNFGQPLKLLDAMKYINLEDI